VNHPEVELEGLPGWVADALDGVAPALWLAVAGSSTAAAGRDGTDTSM